MDYVLTLSHHGILGQKWGVRRFQNKDGTLTSEGKRRHNRYGAMDKTDEELTSTIKRRKLEDSFNKTVEFEENPRNLQNLKSVVDSSKTFTNAVENAVSRSNRKKANEQTRTDLSGKTDKELRDAINRELLERQYNKVFNSPTVSKGRILTEEGLQMTGDVLAITASSLGIALSVKKLLG